MSRPLRAPKPSAERTWARCAGSMPEAAAKALPSAAGSLFSGSCRSTAKLISKSGSLPRVERAGVGGVVGRRALWHQREAIGVVMRVEQRSEGSLPLAFGSFRSVALRSAQAVNEDAIEAGGALLRGERNLQRHARLRARRRNRPATACPGSTGEPAGSRAGGVRLTARSGVIGPPRNSAVVRSGSP